MEGRKTRACYVIRGRLGMRLGGQSRESRRNRQSDAPQTCIFEKSTHRRAAPCLHVTRNHPYNQITGQQDSSFVDRMKQSKRARRASRLHSPHTAGGLCEANMEANLQQGRRLLCRMQGQRRPACSNRTLGARTLIAQALLVRSTNTDGREAVAIPCHTPHCRMPRPLLLDR